jgi:hypothetical protein
LRGGSERDEADRRFERGFPAGPVGPITPNLSFEVIQQTLGVARPELDARRNAALRQAGLE